MENTVSARLIYVTPPTEIQKQRIIDFIKEKYNADSVELTLKEDLSIGGGFMLYAGDVFYDWSLKGRSEQLREKLRNAAAEDRKADLIPLLKTEIENFHLAAKGRESGVVVRVGDGIAMVRGIRHAEYGETVIFDTGEKGLVQDIGPDLTGIVIFGEQAAIRQGSRVVSTGMRAGMPAGERFLGRVVDAMGEPIDGGKPIECETYMPIERPAPGITERRPVSESLATGILAIDSMFPIGRGQRELIIGDRQTGKTSIAMDTILNQKDSDVICIYAAIGQKASTVARFVNVLRESGAMSHTIVVNAGSGEAAAMQYICPYAATALGEYFMYRGQDVLIIYDDLSKHAQAYRAISLLLGRPPGREAYPGDVFYLHSRLLERSARLTEDAGGGSMTALPVIETQAGDVSAYIPTNVISITDGQICLETDLFNEGQRPAVNVGLSVSRVGGAAQSRAMKRASGSMRIDIAQFREMEVFSQFSSDLDEGTLRRLKYGRSLMRVLRQKNLSPMPLQDQVVTLVSALDGAFTDVPVERIKDVQSLLVAWYRTNRRELMSRIGGVGVLTDEMETEIKTCSRKFVREWLANAK
ncbi:MAG: F0F1 ATP synthase subunit alpha [Lachnospiraceae bacterium]|nr:F0F1 ATP synthase subunit alpha [Lachnospiraceae bacterium]